MDAGARLREAFPEGFDPECVVNYVQRMRDMDQAIEATKPTDDGEATEDIGVPDFPQRSRRRI